MVGNQFLRRDHTAQIHRCCSLSLMTFNPLAA
jgi:hypothetical protein